MTTDMIPPEIEAEWFRAVNAGDTLMLIKLLEDHPRLLKVGWNNDLSRTYMKADRTKAKEWKGSTALIEAAAVGNVGLIRKVLQLCNIPTISSSCSIVDEEGRSRYIPKTQEIIVDSNRDESDHPKDLGIADLSSDGSVLEVDHHNGGEHAKEAQKTGPAHTGKAGRLWKTVRTAFYLQSLARSERKLSKGSVSRSSKHAPDEYKDGGNAEKAFDDFMSRKDLRDLLFVKNGYWNVDAITIAIILENDEGLDLLVHAMGECENPPYGIKPNTPLPQICNEDDRLARLRSVTEGVLASFGDEVLAKSCTEAYSKHPYYQTFPMMESLFHFSCTRRDLEPIRRHLWRSFGDLLRFVLNLKDSSGRLPVHIAVQCGTVDQFAKLVSAEDREVVVAALTALDSAGRTLAHIAAARGRSLSLRTLLAYADKYEEVSQSCQAPWQRKTPVSPHSGDPIPIDFNLVSQSNGFGCHRSPYTPVHAALIKEQFGCARLLIEKFPDKDWGTYRYTSSVLPDVVVELDTMELACLMGADVSFIQLLKDRYLSSPKQFAQTSDEVYEDQIKKPVRTLRHPWHALHLVAASGNYENLKLFLGDSRCSPSVEDFEGNTPLHHALLVQDFGFQVHLQDFFVSSDITNFHEKTKQAKEQLLKDEHTEGRQKCIDHLLQTGCPIFKENQLKKIPYPRGGLESNGKLMSWWSEKQSKELEVAQNDCINAANAISVVATLVAATSYVGPLQPPLSYGEDGIYDHNVWVIIFMVCDTMSFYLAIAAITLSLIPSLPAQRRAIKEKPYTPQDMVTLAVTILFPSLVFVFVAFAASSIAVVSANVTSTVAGWFTLATTLIGGLVCLLAFSVFSVKLLVFIFPDNTFIGSFNKLIKFSLSKSQ